MKSTGVAYHEAGHAVTAHVLGFQMGRITIVPNDKSRGHVRMIWNKPPAFIKDLGVSDLTPHKWQCLEKFLIVLLAGPLAMRRNNPRSPWKKSGTGYGEFMDKGTDFQRAMELINMLHGDEAVASTYWNYLRARAEALVKERWAWIDCVARHLLEHGSFEDDIRKLNPKLNASSGAS